jgi:hypothetical protein
VVREALGTGAFGYVVKRRWKGLVECVNAVLRVSGLSAEGLLVMILLELRDGFQGSN